MKVATAVVGLVAGWFLYKVLPRRVELPALAGSSSTAVKVHVGRPDGASAVASPEIRSTQNLAQPAFEPRPSIQKELSYFHSLVDNVPQLVWIADPPGNVYWCNRRWSEYTGRSPPAPMEELGWSLVHPADVERVKAKYELHMASGEPWEDTFSIRAKDGTYRWFLSRSFPLVGDDGHISGWCGTSTDITEQVQAQEALRQADRRKDKFIAMLAHELRNPLAPVMNAALVLTKASHADAKVERMAAIIQRQVTQMAKLIDDLLDVGSIAGGKLEIESVECDLAEIAGSTARDYHDNLAAAGIDMQLALPREPLPVSGDPVRLAQCIGNYLQNAMRFAAGSPVRIHAFEDTSTKEAVVAVTDHGPGIPPELLARLFEPFAQGDQDFARTKGGLGLGLAVTKGLAELHGGRAIARSDGANQGATFELRIPTISRESGTRSHG